MLHFIISEAEKLMVDKQLVTSLCVFVIFSAISIFLSLSKKLRKKSILSPLHFLMIGAFSAAFALFYPVYKATTNDTLMGLVDSVISTVKMFGFDFKSAVIKDLIFGENTPIKASSKIYISFISFFVPMITVTAALNIFKNTAVQIKYALSFAGKAHIFSELNEKSISFAKDIRKTSRWAKIVFTGVNRIGSDEARQELTGEAKGIGALMTGKTVLDFHCLMHRKPSIYLIDNEETTNVKNGIELYKKYQNRSCNIHVFSSLESAETFIDAIDKKDNAKAKINLFNYARIIALDLLAKHPMFEAADRCNSKTMSVLVIGADTVGTECAKAAMWCGRMNNYGFKLRIIGSENEKKRFSLEYGTLKNELKKAGISIDYDFLVADINTQELTDSLNICRDANYIIIATGNDETTINVATKVRKTFIRNAVADRSYSAQTEPTIIPVISNIDYYEVFKTVHESDNTCNVFYPYGCYCDIYKTDTITDWPIEKIAEHIHRLYNKKGKNDKSYHTLPQTEKRSNMATAVHSIYKMKDAGIDFCKSTDESSKSRYLKQGKVQLHGTELDKYLNSKPDGDNKTRMEKLVELEHDRWSIFQVLDGWASWSVDEITDCVNIHECEKPQKFSAAQLHGCIIPNDKLEELGRVLYSEPDCFFKHDRNVTSVIGKNISDIINQQLNKNGNGEHILFYVPSEEKI